MSLGSEWARRGQAIASTWDDRTAASAIRTLPPVSLDVAATVSVSLHNHAPYVVALLESLFAQWRADFELVLVDDHSTDDGFTRVQEVLARHPDIRATTMSTEMVEGMGVLGHVLRLARGRVVIRADSDDIALPGRLAATMACFEGDAECRLVTSNAVLISAESHAIGIHDTRSASGTTRDLVGAAATGGDKRWLGATMAYHRDVCDRFPPLDAELCPYGLDLVLPFRALLLGSHHYVAEPLVGWRQHGANSHRQSGHYGETDAAREKYRALNMMALAQKMRDVAFFAEAAPSPRLDRVVALCRKRFDAEFDRWARRRSRTMMREKRGTGSAEAGPLPDGVPTPPTLADGEVLHFADGAPGADMLAYCSGFHEPEHWGVWTERVAHLRLRIGPAPGSDVRLHLRLVAPESTWRQKARIRVGTERWIEAEIGSAQPRDVELRCAAACGTMDVDIVIVVPDALVPQEMGAAGPDARLLGIGLVAVSAGWDSPRTVEKPRPCGPLEDEADRRDDPKG